MFYLTSLCLTNFIILFEDDYKTERNNNQWHSALQTSAANQSGVLITRIAAVVHTVAHQAYVDAISVAAEE